MSVNTQRGAVSTTMGLRKRRPPMCSECGQRKDTVLVGNANGGYVCSDCAKAQDVELMRQPDAERSTS